MNPCPADLPHALAAQAQTAWEHILERAGVALAAELAELLQDRPEALQLPRVLACSPFVADTLRRHPKLLLDLLAAGHLQHSLPADAIADELTRR